MIPLNGLLRPPLASLSLTVTTCIGLVATPHLFAASSPTGLSEEVIALPTFQVSTNQDSGYRASNSVSATRINTAISDLPFAVTAFTSQFISDIDAHDLQDIGRFAAGVTDGSREFNAGTDVFSIRGFLQSPEHDGFYESSTGNIYVDPVNIDRVEVVKGAASLLYGAVEPGGIVNYITKRATTKPFSQVLVEGGSYKYGRTTIDINQPIIADKLLFRLNAAETNDFEYAEPSKSNTLSVDPTVTWNITPKLSVTLTSQDFYRRESPPAVYLPNIEVSTPASVVAAFNSAAGNPSPASALTNKVGPDAALGFQDASDPGYLLPYPRLSRTFNYTSANDYRITKIETLNAEVNATLSDHWIARGNFDIDSNYSSQLQTGINAVYLAPANSLDYSNGTWTVDPAWTALSASQQLAAETNFANLITSDVGNALLTQNGAAAPAIVARRVRLQTAKGRSVGAQFNAAGSYKFSWATIKPVFGGTYDKNYIKTVSQQNNGNAASPYFRAWDVDTASPTFYINHDEPSSAQSLLLPTTSTNQLKFTSSKGVFALVNGSFLDDHVFFLAGERYTRFETQTTQYSAVTGLATPGVGLSSAAATPQIGFGYKPIQSMMIYASYSKSFDQPSQPVLQSIQQVNGTYVAVPGAQTAPLTSTQYETGIKTDFLNGRISSTLAVYQIKQDQDITQLNQVVNGVTLVEIIQGTSVEGRGVEYEVTLSPTDSFQIFASVAEEDIRNVQEPLGYAYYLGAHPQNSAKTLGNLWSRYTIPESLVKGLWIAGGFNYVGKSAGDNKNAALVLPAYCLWSSAIGYDWTYNNRVINGVLHWENMTNKFYQPANQVRGLPSRVLVSLSTRF